MFELKKNQHRQSYQNVRHKKKETNIGNLTRMFELKKKPTSAILPGCSKKKNPQKTSAILPWCSKTKKKQETNIGNKNKKYKHKKSMFMREKEIPLKELQFNGLYLWWGEDREKKGGGGGGGRSLLMTSQNRPGFETESGRSVCNIGGTCILSIEERSIYLIIIPGRHTRQGSAPNTASLFHAYHISISITDGLLTRHDRRARHNVWSPGSPSVMWGCRRILK